MTSPQPTAVLAPSYRLPLGLFVIAVPVFLLRPWLGSVVALLAAFLLVQTTQIRLAFTPTELEVRRGETVLRRFPYADWQSWTLFWPSVPILFYFKEVNSIHFLPVLFDPAALVEQLHRHCSLAKGTAETPESSP